MSYKINLLTDYKQNNQAPGLGNGIFLWKCSTLKELQRKSYTSNFSLKYMQSGFAIIKVDNQIKRISAGQSLLVNYGMKTKLKEIHGTLLSVFIAPEVFFDVHNILTQELSKIEYPFDPHTSHIDLYDEVSIAEYPFANKIVDQALKHQKFLITEEFYYGIAYEILRKHHSIYKRINSINSRKSATRKELFTKMEKAHEKLLCSLNGTFDIDEIAKEACLSKYHLIRTFKEVYGVTPHKFYVREKILAAKEYFLNTNDKITLSDLAMKFGFTDYPTFSKQFKAIEGYPPSKLIKLASQHK